MTRRMWKRARTRNRKQKGQSILEYLVILTVVVLAILFIRTAMSSSMNNTYNQAANKVNQAANMIGNMNVGPH